MPMKDLLHRLQPLQLYIVLGISIAYFLLQLFLSHITHALTLLVDSYHMLCNIIALTGCIITIKHSRNHQTIPTPPIDSTSDRVVEIVPASTDASNERQNTERLKNTFGWTRIDILTMLIVCIFLASLCFSLLVEAVQTLIHIDHQDTMHLPIPVLITGALGFVINAICYVLIGGYTFHQGSFLHVTSDGEVILDRVVSDASIRQGERRLSRTKNNKGGSHLQRLGRRQNFLECFRDICSSIFVVICAIIVYFDKDEIISKFVDPLISIVSCIILLILSYPYMKESCLILLQTIPGSIDIELFKQNLLKSFEDIVNVHDLHIWQLTGNKYVSTAHIIFQNPLVYVRIMNDVEEYFHDQGITIVTIQPEFTCSDLKALDCMVKCATSECQTKICCKDSSADSLKQSFEVLTTGTSPSTARKRCFSISKSQSHQILSSTQMEKKLDSRDNISTTMRTQSACSLSKSNEKLHSNRPVSDLEEDFGDRINPEMFDLDKIGMSEGKLDGTRFETQAVPEIVKDGDNDHVEMKCEDKKITTTDEVVD